MLVAHVDHLEGVLHLGHGEVGEEEALGHLLPGGEGDAEGGEEAGEQGRVGGEGGVRGDDGEVGVEGVEAVLPQGLGEVRPMVHSHSNVLTKNGLNSPSLNYHGGGFYSKIEHGVGVSTFELSCYQLLVRHRGSDGSCASLLKVTTSLNS